MRSTLDNITRREFLRLTAAVAASATLPDTALTSKPQKSIKIESAYTFPYVVKDGFFIGVVLNNVTGGLLRYGQGSSNLELIAELPKDSTDEFTGTGLHFPRRFHSGSLTITGDQAYAALRHEEIFSTKCHYIIVNTKTGEVMEPFEHIGGVSKGARFVPNTHKLEITFNYSRGSERRVTFGEFDCDAKKWSSFFDLPIISEGSIFVGPGVWTNITRVYTDGKEFEIFRYQPEKSTLPYLAYLELTKQKGGITNLPNLVEFAGGAGIEGSMYTSDGRYYANTRLMGEFKGEDFLARMSNLPDADGLQVMPKHEIDLIGWGPDEKEFAIVGRGLLRMFEDEKASNITYIGVCDRTTGNLMIRPILGMGYQNLIFRNGQWCDADNIAIVIGDDVDLSSKKAYMLRLLKINIRSGMPSYIVKGADIYIDYSRADMPQFWNNNL